ncbi:T9SS type A sorting domain-containing protein [Vaginella massiliensis]|uniref:T9SS type A sorting domain-containing protein n=1 Tax=Vaginella massiliensis TaxID=1816680 RepID=UPI000837DBF8|nr:T9SS type A sorting domain-containing protein [Vaginella massiliensis]
MTRIIFVWILLLFFKQTFSQTNTLKEHCWKLEELTINNVVYTIPENNEIDYIFLNIGDSTTEDGGYFGTTFCNYLFGNILIDENEFTFTSHSNSNLECELEENSMFDDLYFHEFYVNHINSPFEYSFYQENNWLFLTITNADFDTVKYSVYLNQDLTNNVWILEKLIYNQQEIYPPEELENEIEFLFPDNNSSSVTSTVCNEFNAIINISESVLINSGGGVTFDNCENPDFDNFDIIYIGSFLTGWLDNPVFQYGITSDNENLYLTLTDHIGNQAFYFTESLSVIENENLEIKIYPNPVNGNLTVNGINQDNVSLLLFDITGKIVYQNKLNVNQNKIEISVSNLEKGVYFIKIFNEFGKFLHSEKVLKF